MSSFLLARLPSNSKALEVVDFMQRNHFCYRISSNFGRLFNLILGDSRLSAAIDCSLESECGFEEKRLTEQLTKIFDAVEVKEEAPDDDEERQPKRKLNVAEQVVDEVKQEDSDNQLDVPLPILKNDGCVGEDQEIKEEEPDDYEPSEVAIRNVKPSDFHGRIGEKASITDADEHRGEGDREVKEEPIDSNFTVEDAAPEEAPMEMGYGGSVGEGDFSMENVDDGDEEEELIEEQEYEEIEHEEDAELDTEYEMEDVEEEDDSDDSDDYEEYEQEDEDGDIPKKKKDRVQKRAPNRADFLLLFTCPIKTCPSCYTTFEELEEHVESHSDKENFSCNVCKTEFSSLEDAMEHIQKREQKECCECNKKFAKRNDFLAHLRTHTGSKPYGCGHCEKSFTQMTNLKKHERIHTGEKPYVCDDCGHRFTDKSCFNFHRKTHAPGHTSKFGAVGRQLFTCLVRDCSSSCETSEELRKHLENHSEKEEFFCDVCKKGFLSVDDVMEHIQKREQKECCQCGKKWRSYTTLIVHHRVHTGERPFTCGLCKKGFSQKGILQLHEMRHSEIKRFECGQCKKGFASKRQLKDHERSHTGVLLECNQCSRTFTQKTSLTIHMRTHTGSKPFECGECKKSFSQSGNLKRHELIHSGAKLFKCDDCGRGFIQKKDLIIHQRSHTGEKPFACEECDKKFISRVTLRRHVDNKHK